MKKINQYIFLIKPEEQSPLEATVVHNKKSRKNKINLTKTEYEETIIEWMLSKYVKQVEYDINNCEFFPISPSEELNNGISAESILEFINSNLIFDYLPQNNDMLKISMEYVHPTINRKRRPYIGNYISFIYKNEWSIMKDLSILITFMKLLGKVLLRLNEIQLITKNPPHSGFFYFDFLLFNSLSISPNSRPVCPATEVFSCARLVRYGTTSFTGP